MVPPSWVVHMVPLSWTWSELAVHMVPPSWAVHMVPLPWTWSLPCTWCRSPGPGACCAHGAALLGRAHGAASLDLAHATVDYITMDFM
mmetsp:Transcript_3053/g.6624  ORF Transcript_3053/g.6624 Transcript_3053/m.6624 type:complete len:88 (+) Transcript_3053:42-305(+)